MHNPTIYEDGAKYWYNDYDMLHREDGPAMVFENGTEAWYINGKFHRIDGPAVIKPDGYKAWYINNERHRENGPAIIYPSGEKSYWLNDKRYAEDAFKTIQFFNGVNIND